ncbi:MAG: hypothetical protein NZ920_03870 [Aigarchaeota archaeon]|nr:hypothetical protein [Aigarchaeota archaeon]MDW8092242.1 hypothetical protein [Nitrososphaerota archaeon]
MEGTTINRSPNGRLVRFNDVFGGFERLDSVKRILGDRTKEILESLMVEVVDDRRYMWVNDKEGRICVNRSYLERGNAKHIYLDVIHELVHIRQLREGKDLFDRTKSYVDRETEIEAYRITVEEAKRIGMTKREIIDYLSVEWLTRDEVIRLARSAGVDD